MTARALESERTGNQIAGRPALGMFPPGIVPDVFHDGGQGRQIRGDQIIVPVDGIFLSWTVHVMIRGNVYLLTVPRRNNTAARVPPANRPNTMEAAMILNLSSYCEGCNLGYSHLPK